MLRKKSLLFIMAVAALALILAACAGEPQIVTVEVTKEVVREATVIVEGTPVVVTEVVVETVVVTEAAVEEGPREYGSGDTLVIGMPSDITTLNQWTNLGADATTYNFYVLADRYPTLFGYAQPFNQWVPALAADFPTDLAEETDADGTPIWTSTVTLRQDVSWSDGTPVTANDIAFTAETVLTLGLADNWSASYDATYLARVEAVDDYTARFVYIQRPGLARHQFGALLGTIMPAHFWEPIVAPLLEQAKAVAADAEDRDAQLEPLRQTLFQADATGEPAAGGYSGISWEVGAFVTRDSNPSYSDAGRVTSFYEDGSYKSVLGDVETVAYGEAAGEPTLTYTEGPYFKQQLFQVYSADSMILALANGEIDAAWTPLGFQEGQIAQMTANPDVEIVVNPSNGFRYMGFNFAQVEWQNKALRQAINCMVDKDFLTNNLLQGAAIPVTTMVPAANSFWYNPNVGDACQGMTTEERFNQSIAWLKEAGYSWETEPAWNAERGGSVDRGTLLIQPDGTPFPEKVLLGPSAGYDPLRATAAVFIEQYMQDLGIPVTAELTNFNNIVDVVFGGGDWDLYILGWGLSLFPDYLCDFFGTGAGFNVLNYSNTDLDTQCGGETPGLLSATSLDEAQGYAYALQEILADDLPYILLFTTPIRDAYNAASMGYAFTTNLDGLDQTQHTLMQDVLE